MPEENLKEKTLAADRDLLIALVKAAAATTKLHEGKETEMYSLGALEATANFVYVIAAQSGDEAELESVCQEHAKNALDRLEELRRGSSLD